MRDPSQVRHVDGYTCTGNDTGDNCRRPVYPKRSKKVTKVSKDKYTKTKIQVLRVLRYETLER